MKKRFTLMLALVLALSLAACGGVVETTKDNNGTIPPASQEDAAAASPRDEPGSGAESDTETETVTVEGQVLFDQSDVKLTLKSMGNSLLGTDFKVLAEN
ncbi:MAG: hypothetical protein LBU77_03960, partial [Clostridiales bacterium]|nr:hypothetical protein [Clostridiales bacterium]